MASEDDYTIIADNQMNAENYDFEFVFNWDVLTNAAYINNQY